MHSRIDDYSRANIQCLAVYVSLCFISLVSQFLCKLLFYLEIHWLKPNQHCSSRLLQWPYHNTLHCSYSSVKKKKCRDGALHVHLHFCIILPCLHLCIWTWHLFLVFVCKNLQCNSYNYIWVKGCDGSFAVFEI